MAIRTIRQSGDEVLRKTCKPVERVDDRIRELLGDLADTLYDTPNGGGLAAPQVGILRRLAVIDIGEGLLQLVNPEIIHASGEQIGTEGCLSFPGVWVRHKRPAKVVVRAWNERGEKVEIHGQGLLATCLCHEIDHLNGVVLTDGMLSIIELP